MKTLLKYLLPVFFFGLNSCEKDSSSREVELYINNLLSGEYNELELPVFKASHIPELLEYREATTLITTFPRNPISSYYQGECRLGVYVLWTIESIREVENGNRDLILGFPSKNSILALRDTHEFMPFNDEQSHRDASRAYYEWWYSSYNSEVKMRTDPLAGTKYRWH